MILQQRHLILGHAAPKYPNIQAEAAVLVDHIQEVESATISGGSELEVRGPDLLGMLGLVTTY